MARITRLFLTTVCMLTFAQGAGARSVEKIADTPKAEQASLLYFGKPLDCKIDTCPKKEETAAPAPVKTDKPLVDAYGMPTNMPTLIRGSEVSQQVTVSVPRKASSAASTTAAAPASGSGSDVAKTSDSTSSKSSTEQVKRPKAE
jgi:hypothetical protein